MQSGDIEMKELLQQALDALITSLAYVDATSAIAEVQGALKAIEQAIAQEQETKARLPHRGHPAAFPGSSRGRERCG